MAECAKDGLLHLLAATAQADPPDGAAAAALEAFTIAPTQSEAAGSLIFQGDTFPSNLFPKGGFSPFPAFPVHAQHLQPTYATAMAMNTEEQSRVWQQ